MEKPPQHIDFDTDIYRSMTKGFSREWLVINEIDKYASGTIAEQLSRLKSLSNDNPAFIGKHMGITQVYQNPQQIRGIIELLQYRFCTQGLPSIGERFDREPPPSARSCIAAAWTVTEIIQVRAEISIKYNIYSTQIRSFQ